MILSALPQTFQPGWLAKLFFKLLQAMTTLPMEQEGLNNGAYLSPIESAAVAPERISHHLTAICPII